MIGLGFKLIGSPVGQNLPIFCHLPLSMPGRYRQRLPPELKHEKAADPGLLKGRISRRHNSGLARQMSGQGQIAVNGWRWTLEKVKRKLNKKGKLDLGHKKAHIWRVFCYLKSE